MKSDFNGELIIYQTDDGQSKIECRLVDRTIWLSQILMAELFNRTKQNISLHLANLFEEGELDEDSVVKYFLTTAADGKSYKVAHYNLEAILAVGFRVKSLQGTQFRRWANTQLQELIVKGFVMDDERLKNPPVPGTSEVPDYFDELLERIRDIRASERRMYLRVREIFALAADYDSSRNETTKFFRIIQNKLHFAVTGKTAAELILERADQTSVNMGLTVWKGDILRKGDVTIARNYLDKEEINELNRIVTMWLDFAEDQSKRRKQVFLEMWQERLDEFLKFNDRAVLPNAGSVSKKEADTKAEEEYQQFAAKRRQQSEDQGAEETIKLLNELGKSNE
jgi:hypothetical protein